MDARVATVALVAQSRAKNRKSLKIENFEKRKNSLEIWWIEICPQNLAWIHAAVSEKSEFTDVQVDGQTMDD